MRRRPSRWRSSPSPGSAPSASTSPTRSRSTCGCARATTSCRGPGPSGGAIAGSTRGAIIWVIIAVIIFCLPFTPASVPWFDEFDAPAFNYTPLVLVLGALVGIWWAVSAKNRYTGPVRTLEEDEVTARLTTTEPEPSAHRARRARRDRRHAVARRPAQGGQGRHDRHVVTAFTDMQGRLFGKRIQAEYFLDDVVEHGVEGCNYLLALDMEMDPDPRLRDGQLGGRLRRLRDRPGHGDAAPDPVARPHRARAVRRREPRRLAGRRLAAPGADRPVRARARDGLHADVRLRARVLPLQGELRRGARARTTAASRRRSPTSSTTTSSPRRWTRRTSARSAAACTAPASRSSSPRARPGTGSTRSTRATRTRSPPRTGTRSTRTASRRSRS